MWKNFSIVMRCGTMQHSVTLYDPMEIPDFTNHFLEQMKNMRDPLTANMYSLVLNRKGCWNKWGVGKISKT